MAKSQEARWNDKVQKLVDDEVQSRAAQVTHKLKQQMATAVKEQKEAMKAADNLRRELADEKAKVETAKAKVKQLDKDLARAKVTIRSLQDQAVKEGQF